MMELAELAQETSFLYHGAHLQEEIEAVIKSLKEKQTR
jgi:hypothetical protein